MSDSGVEVVRMSTCCSTVLALLLTWTSPLHAQSREGVMGDLLRDITTVETKIIGPAEAIPAAVYEWRPAEGVRSQSGTPLVAAGVITHDRARTVGARPPNGGENGQVRVGSPREAAMISTEKLSALIGAIYDCAVAPDRWEATLQSIRAELSFATAVLAVHPLPAGDLTIFATSGIAPEASPTRGLCRQTPWMGR